MLKAIHIEISTIKIDPQEPTNAVDIKIRRPQGTYIGNKETSSFPKITFLLPAKKNTSAPGIDLIISCIPHSKIPTHSSGTLTELAQDFPSTIEKELPQYPYQDQLQEFVEKN